MERSVSGKAMKDVLVVDLNPTSPVFTAYFSHGLATNGMSVDVLSPNNRPELVFLKHLNLNYIGRNISRFKWAKPVVYILNWLTLIRIASGYRAIHIQWLPMLRRSSLDLWMIKRLMRVNKNVGYTVHNIFPHDNSSETVKNRYLLLYKLLPKLVVHTPASSNILVHEFGISPKKVTEVPHGPLYTEMAAFDPGLEQDSTPLTLGMIGIIRPYKGHENALKLLALAKSKGLEFRLVIAGAGSPEYIQLLRDMARELGVHDLITMSIGYLSDQEVIDWHNNSHGILAPYKRIEQSGAAITAVSLGKPVIGYAIGGLVDLITNKQNGYLVPAGDLEQLYTAVHWLSEQSHRQVYENCMQSVEEFSWKKVANLLKRAYQLD